MARLTEDCIVQSGAIPFRFGPRGIEVMLVTSRKTGDWILPKGHIEPFMSPESSALKEAWEEAGIEGAIIGRPVGSWTYEKNGLSHRVEYFPLAVENVLPLWPERGSRKRRWYPIARAVERVADAGLRRMLTEFPEILACLGIVPAATA
jgi:8-oxo-dGTP pyrophosphatase MutT (NUDIX family)